jgi:iduronate 2-sulfatase
MNNTDYFRRKFPETVALPQYLKNNGCATLRSGKIFHGGIDDQISRTEGGNRPIQTSPNAEIRTLPETFCR